MKTITLMVVISCLCLLQGCQSSDINLDNTQPSPHSENLLFHLAFDESQGNQVVDRVSNQTSVIQYVFSDATYQPNQDPKWVKDSAVRGSSLVFDGYSNKIAFDSNLLDALDTQFTIDVFVAPRMFEWSAPNTQDHLQVIIGSYNKEKSQGFLLGMHKYGHYSFQIGLGDRWVELWNEWNPLDRYTWNHITATFNGTTGEMALYKNGEFINSKNDVFGAIQRADESILIGASHRPEMSGLFELNMFNGMMDELKLFKIAYNATDVLDNHSVYKNNNKIQSVDFEDVWLDESILSEDIHRPIYHANPPQHWMNEPHALFYYKGYYHMFYQFNLTGPYWRQIVWGHWITKDLITWENLKEAIIMEENSTIKDGAWSGSVTFKEDGTPVLLITAGDDEKANLYSNQNLVIATPKDTEDPYLLDWEVSPKLSITLKPDMGKTNEFRDFSVYQENGVSYLLATGAKFNGQGTAYLYTSTDDTFMNWTYQGHLFEPSIYPEYLGSSWELVHMIKLFNEDKTVSKYAFILSPAGRNADNDIYYYLGNFNKQTMKFEPEDDYPRKMDFGENVFTGPGIYHDQTHDRVLISSITQDLRNEFQHYQASWAHNAGMPKEILLDDAGKLIIRPINEIEDYIQESYLELNQVDMTDVNEQLATLSVSDQTIYLKLVMNSTDASFMGIQFKKDFFGHYSSLIYDVSNHEILFDTRASGSEGALRYTTHDYDSHQRTLTILMIIDHSMVEIYINGEIAITASIYNIGTGLEIISDGPVVIESINYSNFEGVD